MAARGHHLWGRGRTVAVALASAWCVAVALGSPVRSGAAEAAAAPAASAARSAPSVGPVVLLVPAGWARSADGSVVAQAKADLTAVVPAGPRARLVPTPQPATKPGAVAKQIKAAGKGAPEVVEEPFTLSANALRAVAVTMKETDHRVVLVRRYLTIVGPSGETVNVVLEAPEAQWPTAKATLATIPAAN